MARSSTLLLVFAAFFWGVSGGIGAFLIQADWAPFVVGFYRGIVGLFFVLIWLVYRPNKSGLTCGRLWFWSIVAGLGVAGNFGFYFISIAQSSVAVAATLMYCAPVFVYLISFNLKLEEPTPFKWASIALVIVGIFLLARIDTVGAGEITPVGVMAGLMAGLSYAIFIFGFKYAAPYGSPQAVLVVAFSVVSALLALGVGSQQIAAVLGSPRWPLFLMLGVLGAGLSFILYVVGVYYSCPTVASIVAMIEPVTAALFGVLLLNEHLGLLQLVGMGMILSTVTVLSLSSPSR